MEVQTLLKLRRGTSIMSAEYERLLNIIMNTNTITPQDLIRKAVIEVAQLPENELLVVIEMLELFKKQRTRPNYQTAAEIVSHAKIRAADTSNLPRAELMQQFSNTVEEIRAEAVAKGTSIEGELEGD
jgi:hypothetical protein